MPVIAVLEPYEVFRPGNGLPDVPLTGVEVTEEQEAQIRAILAEMDPKGRIRIVDYVGDPGSGVPQAQIATHSYVQAQIDALMASLDTMFADISIETEVTTGRLSVENLQTGTGTIDTEGFFKKPEGIPDPTTYGKPLLTDGAGNIRYGTEPLNLKETFQAKGDGVTDDTAAIKSAIAFAKTLGGGPVVAPAGTYIINDDVNFDTGLIGAGVGATAGPGTTYKRTIFKRGSASGKVRFGPGPNEQFGGTFSVQLGQGPIRDVAFDGADIAGGDDFVTIGVIGSWVVDNIRVDNVGAQPGKAALLIWGAQNCVFRKIQVVNCRSGGITLDYGAGGNTFDTCNTSRVMIDNSGSALLITESNRTAGVGVYGTSGPSTNKFYNCGFERIQDATGNLIRHLAGLNNTFTDCWIAAGSELTQPNDMVYLGADSIGAATAVKFVNCQFTGGSAGQDKITGIHMGLGIGTVSFIGQQSIRQMLVGIRNEGSAGYYMDMDPYWVSVTNKFSIEAGVGPRMWHPGKVDTGTGLAVNQWTAFTDHGGDGRFAVKGAGYTGADHYIYTYPAGVLPGGVTGGAGVAATDNDDGEQFISKMDMQNGDAVIVLLGDSTGDSNTEWFRGALSRIAPDFPDHRIEFIDWVDAATNPWPDPASGAYVAPEVVQVGTGEIVETPVNSDTFGRTGDLYQSVAELGGSWTGTSNSAGDWTLDGSQANGSSETTRNYTWIKSPDSAGAIRATLTATLPTNPVAGGTRTFYFITKMGGNIQNRVQMVLSVALNTGIVSVSLQSVIANAATTIAGPVTGVANHGIVENSATPVAHDFELLVEGATVTLSIDGVQRLQGTIPDAALPSFGNLTGSGFSHNGIGPTLISIQSIETLVTTAIADVTLRAYDGSQSATTFAEYQMPRLARMIPEAPDLVILSSCHNYTTMTPLAYVTEVEELVQQIRDLYPYAGILASSQNPRFAPANFQAEHLDRLQALRVWARKRGYGYLPALEAFLVQPDKGQSRVLADGIHPTTTFADDTTGSGLWASVFGQWVSDRSLVVT